MLKKSAKNFRDWGWLKGLNFFFFFLTHGSNKSAIKSPVGADGKFPYHCSILSVRSLFLE